MSYLIDTHCHLHDREFFTSEQAEEMLVRARKWGVQRIICVSTSAEDAVAAQEFAEKHAEAYWTYGIHPENAGKTTFAVEEYCPSGNPPVAIGEVGLDYHYEGYDRIAQIRLFEEMLQLARDLNLPLSFHVREAFSDFFPVVANFPGVRGVVHSFSDNKRTLRRLLETTDFYIGVNGMATYSTLPMAPLSRILLETDAPFLTPVPFRGIMNEPGYVRGVALWLSARLGVNFEEIEKETTKNAEQLFKFSNTTVRQSECL